MLGDPGTITFGDVMTYGGGMLPYVSNPNVHVNYADLPVTETILPPDSFPMGVSADQPQAACIARLMRENAQTIASYREGFRIINQPKSVSIGIGAIIMLSAQGSTGINRDPLNYQWLKDGSPIMESVSQSANGAFYTKANAQMSDAGTYSVVVSTLGGAVITSQPATVTVTTMPVPVITADPASQSLSAGQSFILQVAATGSGLSYQWFKDGSAVANATSSTYIKNGATTADSGSYICIVTNAGGSVPSGTAIVSVTDPTGGGGPSAGVGEASVAALPANGFSPQPRRLSQSENCYAISNRRNQSNDTTTIIESSEYPVPFSFSDSSRSPQRALLSGDGH
jgi:hypothetical protein